MKKILISLILLTFIGLVKAETSIEVEERDKQAILDISTQIMLASKQGDVAMIMSLLDKSIIIEIKKEGEETYGYNHESYKSFLTQVFSIINSYAYERKNETFRQENHKEIIYEFELDETVVA